MGSSALKPAIAVLIVCGLIGLSFGAWGIYTPQGRSKYDEMDGIYPMLAGLAGAVLVAIALIATLILIVRAHRS